MVLAQGWSTTDRQAIPDQEIARFERLLERRDRASSAAHVHEVQQVNTGMFERMQPPDVSRRENLVVFIKSFRIWSC